MTTPPEQVPVSQERSHWRQRMPAFIRELPRPRFPPKDNNFRLIKPDELKKILADVEPEIIDHILAEMEEIEHDCMRLFRDRDYEASEQQNAYRQYQLGYMALATLATFLGSLQAVSFGTNAGLVPVFALAQTIIAGLATFLSVVSTREPPLPRWLENRRRAEFLRREYIRYLMHLPPYEQLDLKPYQRKQILATRAAKANLGEFAAEDL